MSIRDDSHPYLVFVNNERPFSWNTGFMYSIILESNFIRINSRGIQHSQTPLTSLGEDQWKNAECNPTPDALCSLVKNTTKMLLFPTTDVDIPDKFSDLNPSNHHFLKDFAETEYSPCTYKYSNRAIRVGDDRYEVSLCDILDSNLDFIWDLNKNIVYWRQNTTSTLLYFIYSILAIYLISLMTNNIINILTKYRSDKDQNQATSVHKEEVNNTKGNIRILLQSIKDSSYVIFLLSTLLFLGIMAIIELRQSKTIVTKQDHDTVIILCVYVLLQFFYHYILNPLLLRMSNLRITDISIRGKSNRIASESEETDPLVTQPSPENQSEETPNPPYNQNNESTRDDRDTSFSLLVAFILLLILLVYKTFDTPYLTLMTTLFLMRSWLKLFLFRDEFIVLKSKKQHLKAGLLFASTCMDFFVAIHLLLLVESSVRSGSTLSSSMYAKLHMFVITMTSFTVALGMNTAKKATL